MRLNRDAAQSACEFARYARNRGFEFEQVLHRLEQQQIGAAFDEIAGLFAVKCGQFIERDFGKCRIRRRNQHAGRPHAACNETRALRRAVLVARFTCEARRIAIDFGDARAHAVFIEL